MPFDPHVPPTPQFWAALERRLREAVRLRALRERRVQLLQSAAGAVATIASFGAGLMMMFGTATPLVNTTTASSVLPVVLEPQVGTPAAEAYYHPTTRVTLPDRLEGHGYEVTVLTQFVTDPAADGRVLEVRGPTHLDVRRDPAAGPVVIVIGQAVGTGLSFAG